MHEKKFSSVFQSVIIPYLTVERGNMNEIFSEMPAMAYAAFLITGHKIADDLNGEKIYLKDLSRKMDIDMPETTAIVRRMRDMGFVEWMHDGLGEEGTYIIPTENGQIAFEKQHEILHQFYHKVIEEFGEERFLQMMHMIGEFRKISRESFEKMEEEKQ